MVKKDNKLTQKNNIIKEDIKEDNKALNKINEKNIDDTTDEILRKRLRKIRFDPVKFTNEVPTNIEITNKK